MVTRAAVKIKFFDAYTAREIIIPCHRHCDAFYILKEFGFHKNADYEEIEQGFLTEHDVFLNRIEAWEEAFRCHQFKQDYIEDCFNKGDVKCKELFSEDVW